MENTRRRMIKIVGQGVAIPNKVLTNADLEKMVETNDEWIVSRTGIRERRIAREDQATSDLGIEAAGNALRNAGVVGLGGAVFPSAVKQQEPLVEKKPVDAIDEIARDLHHPRGVGVWRGPGEADAPGGQFDGDEHVDGDEAARRPDLDGEEIGRGEGAPMRAQEGAPRHCSSSPRGRLNSVFLEDRGDRAARDAVAEIEERPADPGTTPARVLPGHADDQASNLVH